MSTYCKEIEHMVYMAENDRTAVIYLDLIFSSSRSWNIGTTISILNWILKYWPMKTVSSYNNLLVNVFDIVIIEYLYIKIVLYFISCL